MTDALEKAELAARIESISARHNLPVLDDQQTKELVERLLEIPGFIADVDLRMLVRMFCREKKCAPIGPIIQ